MEKLKIDRNTLSSGQELLKVEEKINEIIDYINDDLNRKKSVWELLRRK